MRSLRVVYRPEAAADLQDIYRFVLDASQNEDTAAGYYWRIRRRCERIGLVPFGGRPRDDLEAGLRTVPFERAAVIAYKVDNDRVEIVNVFYGGRDFDAFYLGHPPTDAEGAE